MQKMAVKNNGKLDLQTTEKNDVLLFAEDLVDYIMSRSGQWKPTVFRSHSYNTYVPIIRRTIDLISYSLECDHDFLYGKMKDSNLFNSNSYESFDKILTSKYFPECFKAEYFLLYCVNLSVMAVYFEIEGICDARDLAKQYMHQFLQKYDVLVAGWSAICKFAETCVKILRDSLNELEPFDSSPVSDDIVHQDQEQDELNNDESSSSPSEEESFSSGDARSNIEIQRIGAYHNIIGYLRKYAQSSSNSVFQIGLCSLGEPESSGTLRNQESLSGIDVELVNIIGDFKIKTNMLWNKIKLIVKSASE